MFKKNGKTTTLGIIQSPSPDDNIKTNKNKKINKNEKEIKQENKANK